MADSDDDRSTRPAASNSKKARSAAAESQRQKDLNERDKVREAQRAEAAGRRQQRAGRRRGDGMSSLVLPTSIVPILTWSLQTKRLRIHPDQTQLHWLPDPNQQVLRHLRRRKLLRARIKEVVTGSRRNAPAGTNTRKIAIFPSKAQTPHTAPSHNHTTTRAVARSPRQRPPEIRIRLATPRTAQTVCMKPVPSKVSSEKQRAKTTKHK